MKAFYYYMAIILCLSSFLSLNCGECMTEINDQRNEMIYYASFAGYTIPLKPIEPILKEDALSRKTYCIGYYDVDGRLIRFEKYLDGSLFFQHEYTYYDNGIIKESKVTNTKGEIKTNYFDKNGKPIK